MTMPPDFPPPPPPPPPPPEVDEQDDCMAAELPLLPPAPSVSLSLALSAMAAAGWGKEEEEEEEQGGGGGGGAGLRMSGRRARTEQRRAGRLAPGRRLGAAAREREGASRCQETSSAREQRPRPGSGSIALGLAPAGPARSLGRLAKPAQGCGTRPPPPPPRAVGQPAGDALALPEQRGQASLRASCLPAARVPREGLPAP